MILGYLIICMHKEGTRVTQRILVVDDSALSRKRFLAKPLSDAGFEVTEAANGEEGLAAFKEGEFDCIITDLLMPVMDGFEFVEELSQLGCETPILVASADIQETSRTKILEAGAAGFLNKPYSKDELLEKLAETISAPAKG